MSKPGKSWPKRTRAGLRRIQRRLREFGMVVASIASSRHPILVHLIPVRRCNLACTYCNEFDDVSQPVPLTELQRRVDHLAALGARVLTLSGGEPTLHPELDDLIAHIRSHGMIAGLITNGYLLTPERIERLNRAGLDHLQISIDNVLPDEISKKSLKVLDKKLQWLAEHAEFHVNINSVLGSGTKNPQDASVIAHRAVDLGLASTVGIIHDGYGQLRPLSEPERRIYDEVRHLGKSSFGRINQYNPFQEKLAAGKPNNWWRCRAGGRYLYICEDGLVHYCSQQRGYPGIPLENYTREDIRREYLTEKGCAPYCTISCVHQVSIIDRWRDPQTIKFQPPDSAPEAKP
jgi:MoaA/NifB/PqqE/SkfB family radical SAM enzyme